MGPCWGTEPPEGRGRATSPGNRPHGRAIRWVGLAVRDTEWGGPWGASIEFGGTRMKAHKGGEGGGSQWLPGCSGVGWPLTDGRL